jgi:hypothetical protein
MALPTYCPSCRAIRQPNASFCHICGYSYVKPEPAISRPTLPSHPGSRISVGDGFRFGLGFMSAAVIFWLVFSLIFLGFMGTLAGALFRAVPR